MAAEREHIERAYKTLKGRDDKVAAVLVYGEIFGGLYNGKSRNPHIQRGVEYSPNLHFYAFDVAVAAHSKVGRLPFAESLEILKESGFLHSEPLMVGTLEQCLAFEVKSFSTTIPSKLGLPPPINPDDGSLIPNIAEGVVLRTLHGPNHCIKLKSAAFLEVIKCPKVKTVRLVLKLESNTLFETHHDVGSGYYLQALFPGTISATRLTNSTTVDSHYTIRCTSYSNDTEYLPYLPKRSATN